MKLAPVSSASAREERRDRLRRERAAARALRDVYPTVVQLRLELLFQSSTLNNPAPQSHTLHPSARAFFEFPCPFADCDGHFNLGAAVKAAVCDPKGRAAGELGCSGKRAVRVGDKEACQLRLGYSVTAMIDPSS